MPIKCLWTELNWEEERWGEQEGETETEELDAKRERAGEQAVWRPPLLSGLTAVDFTLNGQQGDSRFTTQPSVCVCEFVCMQMIVWSDIAANRKSALLCMTAEEKKNCKWAK